MTAADSVPSLAEMLFGSRLLLVLGIYAVLSGFHLAVYARVHGVLEEGAGTWLWENLYAPMVRAGILMAFLLLAYPEIFGLNHAPTIGRLLFEEQGRFGSLLGVLFLLSLLLPLLPAVGRFPALVLPVQGIAGSALVFHWLAEASNLARVSYWPGFGTVFLLSTLSVAAYWLATRAISFIQDVGTHWDIADLDELVFEAVLLLFQVPVIVIYCASLGRQLTG